MPKKSVYKINSKTKAKSTKGKPTDRHASAQQKKKPKAQKPATGVKLVKKAEPKKPEVLVSRKREKTKELNRDILKAKTVEYAKVIGLKRDTITRLAGKNIDLTNASEASLDELVKEKILTKPQREDLLLVSKLGRLTGENFDLVKAVKTAGIKSPADFVKWERSDWIKVIKEKNIALPSGEESHESYAENIRATVEKSFPTHYLLHRVINNGPAGNLTELPKAIVNTYRRLGVGEILGKENPLEEKQAEISRRFTALKTFYANNPDIDLKRTNFSVNLNVKQDGLEWKGIDPELKRPIQKQMAAFQRAHIMGETHETANKLLEGGFDSASAITSMTEKEFVKNSGLGIEKGRRIYQRALDLAIGASHFFEMIRGGMGGTLRNLPVSNLDSVTTYLREINGYDELFGNQNYCECEHCRSILSPAAYFVDLMQFIMKNIDEKVPVFNYPHHPARLVKRRSDLWKLSLTCSNTTAEIPYLGIVNGVLEAYLEQELAVKDVYPSLKTADWSINQPFDLHLEELRLYISHFGLSLYDIYKEMHIDKHKLYRERFNLLYEELWIIFTPNIPRARKIFGNPAIPNGFLVKDFIRYAGITRGEFDDLSKISFLPELRGITIKREIDSSDIQKYRPEVFENLTDHQLDLLHRYLKLWKKTPWNIREFDLLLRSLKNTGINGLNAIDGSGYPVILEIARAAIIQDNLRLSVEELASILYQLPEEPLSDNGKSFAWRIFGDLEKIKQASDKKPFLYAGLGITEAELLILTDLLSIDLKNDINIKILSDLYRHARIARALAMSIEDFSNVIRLVSNGWPLESLHTIERVIEFSEWLRKSPLKISDLVFILEGTETPGNKFGTDSQNVYEMVSKIRGTVETLPDSGEKSKKMQSLLNDYAQTKINLAKNQSQDEFLKNFMVDFDSAMLKTLEEIQRDFLESMRKMERYKSLFDKLQFKPESITYLVWHKDVFGIADFKSTLDVNHIKNICLYSELVLLREGIEEKLQKALSDFQTNSNFKGSEALLADLFSAPESLIKSISDSFTFNKPALNAIAEFRRTLNICQTLGVQGETLFRLISADFNDYKQASEIALSTFMSKYGDEKIRNEKLEPYRDKINTLKRNALCDYIISRYDKFKDREDLYSFFLLSVNMSGDARTSKLLAAISSLQLYVHRCLVSLEQPEVSPDLITQDEWEWRKNYRVWEANRKVFLYPENYIEPTLRNTKTHIFKELEDELLQQKITKESAEEAYKKYFSQFAELTRLRYAGGYYCEPGEKGHVKIDQNFTYPVNSESDARLFYLFARTDVQPYQYYYRVFSYNHTNNGRVWGNWKKIELAIEAKEVSALIYNGRLYIFWTEVKSKEQNEIIAGTARSKGFVFKVYVKYSFLNENGKCAAPQRVVLGQGDANRATIYSRVNKADFDPVRWEKEKDSIVESFEEKVFRKPYVFKNDNVSDTSIPTSTSFPIGLSYIWSINKYSEETTYTTKSTPVVKPGYVEFTIPAQSFVVTNNDFSDATMKVTVSGVKHGEGGWGPRNAIGDLALDNKDNKVEAVFNVIFKVYPDITPDNQQIKIPVENVKVSVDTSKTVIKDLKSNTMESTFYLSLSRNMIKREPTDADTANIFTKIIETYEREYKVAYADDDILETYIGDGTKALSNYILKQAGDLPYLNRMDQADEMGSVSLGVLGDAVMMGDASTDEKRSVFLGALSTNELADTLYANGLEYFLSPASQGMDFEFSGPYGEYYWEMFFHIPFLIADHFNANRKFKEAKWWYERIFNPTTAKNWQFKVFNGWTEQSLQEILSDGNAIDAYKKDSFNPHAIARLRISSYQKAVVMKYIDNLLDWGDYLFTQDTRESINEAEMLYKLASDILGKKPVKTDKCDTPDEIYFTYELIQWQISDKEEFLINLENFFFTRKQAYNLETSAVERSRNLSVTRKIADFGELRKLSSAAPIAPVSGVASTAAYENTRLEKTSRKTDSKLIASAEKEIGVEGFYFNPIRRSPAFDLVRQTVITYSGDLDNLDNQGKLAFCVPENKDLAQYWGRVEDRLFKIWNCMNIRGIRRSLSLFQPPIDPMMLVRLRASGLSLEDAVAPDGTPPNYRFTYLLEKARQFTKEVQAFGSALLSALEKKDAEELILLHSVQERNILNLTKEIKKRQIKDAEAQYKSIEEGIKNTENRIAYYTGLIDTGLIPWEVTEQASKWTAAGLRTTEAVFQLLAGITAMVPQLGSPMAITFGGVQLHNGAAGLGLSMRALADMADNIGMLAGLEASHQRRDQEWKQQLKLAEQELKQVNQQLIAAEIRQAIAERDLEIHEKNMEQSEELYDFYKDKFTGMGLYNYLASGLNTLYLQACNMASELAKSAEKAYRIERFDEGAVFIKGDNWQSDKAGFLAGERLLYQLQDMEKSYIENNARTPEITQTFSLAMLDPSALLNLRQNGSCKITIPHLAFELLYPGQYRRIIKSVRLTIPCIAGPYTNISAKLTLIESSVEKTSGAEPKDWAIAKNTPITAITASSANNDAGMFDFSFRDERYLPFEGAGAVDSTWQIDLPSAVRSFNYDTISDVLLHISYTALDGERVPAEAKLEGLLKDYVSKNGFRLFSLRHEFPNSFNLLLSSESKAADFTIEKNHFSYILSGYNLTITGETKIYFQPKKDGSISFPADMKIDKTAVNISPDCDINGIKAGTVTLQNTNTNPVRKWTIDVGTSGLGRDNLEDILILIKYTI